MPLRELHTSTRNSSWLGGISQRNVAPAEEGKKDESGVKTKDQGKIGVWEVEGGDEVEGQGQERVDDHSAQLVPREGQLQTVLPRRSPTRRLITGQHA